MAGIISGTQADEFLDELFGVYNKTYNKAQRITWATKLMNLDLETVEKTIEKIIKNPSYETKMPTYPQFYREYRKILTEFLPKEKEQKYCKYCNNKGYGIKRINGRDYALHCDFCEKGEKEKIDYTNSKGERIFSEPISKYLKT